MLYFQALPPPFPSIVIRGLFVSILLSVMHIISAGESISLPMQYMLAESCRVLAADEELTLLACEGVMPCQLELYHVHTRCSTILSISGITDIISVIVLHDNSLLILCNSDREGPVLYHCQEDGSVKKVSSSGQPDYIVPIREILHKGKHSVLLQGMSEGQGEPGLYLLDLQSNEQSYELYVSPQPETTGYAIDKEGKVAARICWQEDGGKYVRNETRELFRTSAEVRLQLLGVDANDNVYLIHDQGREGACLSRLNLKTGEMVMLAEEGESDILDILITPGGEIAGYCTIWDKYRYKSLLSSGDITDLENILPYGTQILPQQVSSDGQRMLVKLIPPGEPMRTVLWERGVGLHLSDRVKKLPPTYTTHFSYYPASDGTMIPVYYTLPDGTGPFPTVVFVHGGPRMRSLPGYDWRVQYLVHEGFAVVQPQFRGSRGWGKSFMQSGNRQWGKGVMQTDVNDVLPWLVNKGIARVGNVAIFGGSYGGYAVTASLCFFPGLFACGVSLFGPQDLILYLTCMNAEDKLCSGEDKETIGDVSDPSDRTRLMDISPALNAEKFQEPLLLYYGEKDTLISPDHSRKLAAALRKAGKDVIVISRKDEAHGFTKPENEAWLYAHHIVPFLNKHLLRND